MAEKYSEEFEAFYDTSFSRVMRFAMSLSPSTDDAFDLAQDAFVRTWAAWERVRVAEEPIRFTMKVAANLAISGHRRSSRFRALIPSLASRSSTGHAAGTDVRLTVQSAVRKLPKRERSAVVLAYLADLPTDEVARILEISPATVRVHLNHARRRLAGELTRDSDEND